MIMNKCSDRSMVVKLPASTGNYDRPTNQPSDGQSDSKEEVIHYTSNKSKN